jgi:hypothetical protein
MAKFEAETEKLFSDLPMSEAPADFVEKLASLAEALGEITAKAGISEDQLVLRHYNQRLKHEGPGTGLSSKDVVILILVALLLMQHGGDARPTALGEAIESNQISLGMLLVALATLLKKSD